MGPGRVRGDPALPDTLALRARAKINLFLRVLGRRADGYHELQTVILPIDLADDLLIHAHADPGGFRTLSLALAVEGDPEATRGVPADESNLVIRAAHALAEHGGVRGFAEATLTKRIPAAAGLGGGSADAAATLVALNELWGVGLGEQELRDIGASIGSDVPALLAGGPVVVRGRGERVAPIDVAEFSWALVTFPFRVATADAFRWWDEDEGAVGPDPAPIVQEAERTAERGRDPSVLGALLYNDLAPSVIRRHPAVAEARAVLLEAGAEAVVMCGSGPSLAALLPADAEPVRRGLRQAARELERAAGATLLQVRSQDGGAPRA